MSAAQHLKEVFSSYCLFFLALNERALAFRNLVVWPIRQMNISELEFRAPGLEPSFGTMQSDGHLAAQGRSGVASDVA